MTRPDRGKKGETIFEGGKIEMSYNTGVQGVALERTFEKLNEQKKKGHKRVLAFAFMQLDG
jgi:hypothetical protein